MVFNTGAALLDAIVLSVVSMEPEGTYGYRITQEVRSVLNVSESTLYPVLRRLQKDDCLSVYDREYGGRNRKDYYKIPSRAGHSLACTGRSGADIQKRFRAFCFTEGQQAEWTAKMMERNRKETGKRQKRKEASGGGEKNGRSSRAGWSACYE